MQWCALGARLKPGTAWIAPTSMPPLACLPRVCASTPSPLPQLSMESTSVNQAFREQVGGQYSSTKVQQCSSTCHGLQPVRGFAGEPAAPMPCCHPACSSVQWDRFQHANHAAFLRTRLLNQVLPAEGQRHSLKEPAPTELSKEGAGYK